ncbi:MAG: DUF58 domain-containing protein [Cyclobacteriaceae bacterium]
MKDILKKLRRYDIRIRKAINSQMQGDFRSIFKGAGLEYDDVRQYQWGDDVRTIHWGVTAKGHGTFVKTYIEEKEQTVFFLVDVSASQEIGKENRQKIDLAKEITGLLSISAVKEGSKVGVLSYSDQVEDYVKPGKTLKHAYEIIDRLFSLKPKSRKTDLNGAIKYVLNLLNKKTVVFVVSDFIDEGYLQSLKGLARKHDLVVIDVSDKREGALPSLGIVPLYEKESGKTVWLNTSSSTFKDVVGNTHGKNKESLADFCRRNDVNYVSIATEDDYVPALIKLFRHRNRSNARRTR